MQTILSREKVDSGSNYNFPDKMEIPSPPMSVFDHSHLVSTTIPNAGLIVPLTWFRYFPKDRIKISVRHLLRVMPQVVPLLSRQRIFIHAFAMNYGDLQNDFQTFITKGYDGNETLQLAPLTTDNIDSTIYDNGNGIVEPCSLADYLHLPQGASYSDLIASGITCLPFLMYESIYAHYYMNKNYYISNRNWLPNDPEAFRVNYQGILASNTDSDHPKVYFGKLHYRDYPYDYFTSALPFAQRGNRPTLPINITGGNIFNFTSPVGIGLMNGPTVSFVVNSNTLTPYGNGVANNIVTPQVNLTGTSKAADPLYTPVLMSGSAQVDFDTTAGAPTVKQQLLNLQSKTFNDAIKGSIATTIGLDEIRDLARAQVELEKAARTDGSYLEWGLTFFGVKPSTGKQCRPMYIGGTYSSISFTEVLQTSNSTESSALGQIAGHGISVDNSGYIGDFVADDYGMIMILCTIMPDVYYSQGLDKKWTDHLQSEMYLPERAKMGLQPIKNKEIVFSGTSATDEDIFAWQNPFDSLRYLPNKITGKIADSTNASFFPYTQARKFGSVPTYGQSFALADDVRKDYLFATEENAYLAQFAFDIRTVRALPYTPVPNNFGF